MPHPLSSPIGMRSPNPVYRNDCQIADRGVQVGLEDREFEELGKKCQTDCLLIIVNRDSR